MAFIGIFMVIAVIYTVVKLFSEQLKAARKQAELGDNRLMHETVFTGIAIIIALGYAIVMAVTAG